MVGKTLAGKIKKGTLPKSFEKYGNDMESVFVELSNLRKIFGTKADDMPGSAIGLYTYYKKLSQGLRQLMCGARKFAPEHITRNDIVSLTKTASTVANIPYVMDFEKEEVDSILNS